MSPTSSQQALDQITAYRGTMKDPTSLFGEARQRYGVDSINQRIGNLRSAITNTEQLLGGVDDSVTGRTSGTLTTEAARSRLVNLERQPISETLATQQGGLTNEQQNLGEATNQATTEAQLAYGGEQDQLGYLKSVYDALFAREQQQEAIRQYNENLALEKKKASDAASAALAQIGAYNQGNKAPADSTTDPLYQIAYDDVRTRVAQNNDSSLKNDYNATAVSAGYGNAKDKLKLQVYKQLRPDLFGNYTPPSASQWNKPAPAPKPAIKTQIADFATKPGPGNLSTGNARNNFKQWFGWLPWSGQ